MALKYASRETSYSLTARHIRSEMLFKMLKAYLLESKSLIEVGYMDMHRLPTSQTMCCCGIWTGAVRGNT